VSSAQAQRSAHNDSFRLCLACCSCPAKMPGWLPVDV